MKDDNSLKNYATYGDTIKTITEKGLKLTTTTNQYWTLIRWGGSYRPMSETQGHTVIFECEFECDQTVQFESSINNVSQSTTTNGKVSMTVPSDATSCYFSIKSPNAVIYVKNIQIYLQ